MTKKGQISTELIVVIAFVLFLFIPALFFAYSKAGEITNELDVRKAYVSVNRLSSLSNSVGYCGQNSSIIVEIDVPANVEKIEFKSYADGGEVIAHLLDGGDIVKQVSFQVEGDSLTPGFYRIEISSDGEKVYAKKFPS
ncbi:MAG: hypothetical protein ACPL06_01620 [Candidatus Anstonellales archaeon]